MQKRYLVSLVLSFFLVLPVLAASWPATDSTGTNIGSTLLAAESSFEPSGLVWHEGRNQFIAVGGQGLIATLSSDGSTVSTWNIGTSYDLEGVTVVDTTSSYVYLLDENLAAAFEFDLDAGALTGKSWSFIDYVPEVTGYGAEGIAWVANDEQSLGVGTSGGLFYIGWQYDGDIYVFNPDLATSGSVSFVVEIHMTSGYTDLADLTYSYDTQTLYASYASLGLMEERTADGVLITSYSIPGSDQEGVAIVTSCSTSTATVVFGEDSTQQIISYSGYPIICASVDVDGDGVDSSTDCNDADATVNSEQTYFEDADGDLFGSTTTISFCSSTPPSGYTTTATDCDDTDATVNSEQTYYLDADGDTLGSTTTTSFCSSTAPSGYTTNNSDTNDTIPNYGIEISGDSVDNDGDGSVDEYNTIAVNGAHPYYSTLDPYDKAVKASSITTISGTTNGDIIVTFADDSVYLYDAISLTTGAKTKARSVAGTAYIVVSLGKYGVIVHGYTGDIVATTTFQRGNNHPYLWARMTLGL